MNEKLKYSIDVLYYCDIIVLHSYIMSYKVYSNCQEFERVD